MWARYLRIRQDRGLLGWGRGGGGCSRWGMLQLSAACFMCSCWEFPLSCPFRCSPLQCIAARQLPLFLSRRPLLQGIQKCRRKPQNQIAYLYNALAVMASQVGRVEEARAWFEEGTRTLEGAASVALWQAWAVLEAKQGDPTAVRYLFKRALGVNPKSRWVQGGKKGGSGGMSGEGLQW